MICHSTHFIINLILIACITQVDIAYSETSNESRLATGNFQEVSSTLETDQVSPELNDTEESNEIGDCVAFYLNPDEYMLFDNKTVYVPVYKKYYDTTSYVLYPEGILAVCAPLPEIEEADDTTKFSVVFTYISRIGLGISLICIILHLVVFFLATDMRNLPGYNLASLCFSLLFGYVFFLIAHAESVEKTTIPCICAALGMQFFMLSSFLWMSAIAFDVYRSLLKATGKLRLVSRKFSCKKYSFYCIYSWGTPLLFVVTTVILDRVDGVPNNFRPMIGETFCWFQQRLPLIILFAAPVILVVISNVILFGLSAYIVYANRMRMEEDEAYRSSLKRNFLMHGRLATIMGLAWVVAILANVINVMWLWYIYILLNTLQGFFIFLAFTCTQKVKKHIMMKLQNQKRKISTTSTFQSYWNTGLSMENDGDVDFTSEANIMKTEKL